MDLSRLRWIIVLPACFSLLISLSSTGFSQVSFGPNEMLLDKAKPDECWAGIGDTKNEYPAGPTCSTGFTPKVNQGYVWGLASAGQDLWFGTAPNPQCLVIGALLSSAKMPLNPVKTDSYVCEFGQSQYAKSRGLPGAVGDFRPPDIFSFNLESKVETKWDAQIDADGTGKTLRANTIGLRSAGSFNNVVILAGPGLAGGINLFAFDETTQPPKYISSTHLSQYSDIRQWVVAGSNNSLYTGVENANGTGSVLLWNGNASNPFSFQEVSDNIDNEVAYITEHNHRLWVTTWPTAGHYAGLWMSPELPLSGPVHWTEVWSADKYEPDPVTASVYAGGAMASYNGYLYWGMMIVPLTGAIAHFQKYGPANPTPQDIGTTILGTFRAIPEFRCCNQGSVPFLGGTGPSQPTFGVGDSSQPNVELLYGYAVMPKFDPSQGWTIVPNAMNAPPKYGPAGFGNPFNTYTWAMSTYNGSLFVGTFDWSFLLSDMARSSNMLAGLNFLQSGPPVVGGLQNFLRQGSLNSLLQQFLFGADMWRFDSTMLPAVPQTLNGFGNYLNYGFRTMLNTNGSLIVGTANPMNLRTGPSQPEGGWELWSLSGGFGGFD